MILEEFRDIIGRFPLRLFGIILTNANRYDGNDLLRLGNVKSASYLISIADTDYKCVITCLPRLKDKVLILKAKVVNAPLVTQFIGRITISFKP